MQIAQRILNLLEQKELKQNQLSKYIGTSTSTLNNWLNLELNREIPASKIIPICEFFNVSTDYLLGLTDNPNPARTADITLTENEQDVLKILHSISGERQQIKFIGHMEIEAKKYINNPEYENKTTKSTDVSTADFDAAPVYNPANTKAKAVKS